ncbi:MAG: HDOD domain-containing protein [Chitinivibrionales bacterium]|nr:HDOD domain-containing protein [Chitinivibrionales bacterium]
MSNESTQPSPATGHQPLILLFSSRRRIRDILTVGLSQCRYRVIQATNSHVALLKANQFIPDLIIGDINETNIKDILLINRLRNSERTAKVVFLAILPGTIKSKLEQKLTLNENSDTHTALHLIEFPFEFSALLAIISKILRLSVPLNPSKPREIAEKWEQTAHLGKSLFEPTLPTEKKLIQIDSVIHKQWAFPFTVIKALDIMASAAGCCQELGKCIETDLSASAAVLKVANTVYYAKRQGKFNDVTDAVVRLGFEETRNLLSCLALIDLSSKVYTKSGFSRHEFWLHSLSTALISEKLCADSRFKRPELAFVAGLLHDLGKIPLDNNFENVFPLLLEKTTSKIQAFYDTEMDLMNFSHSDLAHYLTGKWNFPPSISSAILNHHKPDRICNTLPLADRVIQESVYVANLLSKALCIGYSCDQVMAEIPRQMLNDLTIPKGADKQFFDAILGKLTRLVHYLNIPVRNMSYEEPRKEAQIGDILFVHGNHPEYHPLIVALTHNGYSVKYARQAGPKLDDNVKTVISMPEPGRPLDVVLYDDDEEKSSGDPSVLKIFITDVDPGETTDNDYTDNNVTFINQRNLDVRLVLNILDRFFGKSIEG